MDSNLRQTIVAVCAAMAVFLGYQLIVAHFFPPPLEPPEGLTTQPTTTPLTPMPPSTGVAGSAPATQQFAPTTSSAGLHVVAGLARDSVKLGGADEDALELELDPVGASLCTLWLTARDEEGQYEHSATGEGTDPYALLEPVEAVGHCSYKTQRVWISEYNNRFWSLADQAWELVEHNSHTAAFATALVDADGNEVLRITKSYRLHGGKPVFDVELHVENLSSTQLTVWFDQDGPVGVPKENLRWDMRQLLTTQVKNGVVDLNSGYQRGKLAKATRAGEPARLLEQEKGAFLWTVLANKYFGIYTRPVPDSGQRQDFIQAVTGLVADEAAEEGGDLLARMTTARERLDPGTGAGYTFEVYAGAKDAEHLRVVDPAYADPQQQYYQLAQSVDARCCCAPLWLRDFMVWLLEGIQWIVGNYGVAIIILVVIIRSLLHPLTVFQQKSMFRMQESMGKIQPRMNAIKEKYANDKVRMNQEMMKLWGEEGINPMSNFVSFIPMFIQMPILVALWTALNTDVNLRHAAFLPVWITDLSAPDALITFDSPITIPVLGWLPLIGTWFTDIPSLNLLPLLMGVSMWLQQKYMPKPHMQAKLDAAREEQQKKPAGGMSPQDQLRQQQVMMYMMSIMFPLMFYYMPSGLNLYWGATNVFGIAESLIVRRQIEREKEERKLRGPQPPKKAGPVSRFFKHIASQAEELQRKADELSKEEKRGKDRKK